MTGGHVLYFPAALNIILYYRFILVYDERHIKRPSRTQMTIADKNVSREKRK
jgi:hypothetical protein